MSWNWITARNQGTRSWLLTVAHMHHIVSKFLVGLLFTVLSPTLFKPTIKDALLASFHRYAGGQTNCAARVKKSAKDAIYARGRCLRSSSLPGIFLCHTPAHVFQLRLMYSMYRDDQPLPAENWHYRKIYPPSPTCASCSWLNKQKYHSASFPPWRATKS